MTTKTLCLLGVLFLAIGSTFAQSAKKPYLVFVSGDHEYSSEETFPIIAKELETKYGFRTTVLKSSPDENAEENIPGLEALEKADVAVFFLRWRRLPAEQLRHIENYLKSGKPIVAFTLGISMVAVTLDAASTKVGEVDFVSVSALSPRVPPELDLVPDGYWDRLGAAMKTVPRLPAQDLTEDPPVMV